MTERIHIGLDGRNKPMRAAFATRIRLTVLKTREISGHAGRYLQRLRLQELPPSKLPNYRAAPILTNTPASVPSKVVRVPGKGNCDQRGDECILNRRNPVVFSQEFRCELFHFRPRNFSISFVFTLHVMKVRSVPWPMILSFIDTGSFALPHHFHRSRLQRIRFRLAVCSISHLPRQTSMLLAFIAYQSY